MTHPTQEINIEEYSSFRAREDKTAVSGMLTQPGTTQHSVKWRT
jgi:hypothetical protein